jgi:hypothetical protein
MRILEVKDIVPLLRAEVLRAGGVTSLRINIFLDRRGAGACSKNICFRNTEPQSNGH